MKKTREVFSAVLNYRIVNLCVVCILCCVCVCYQFNPFYISLKMDILMFENEEGYANPGRCIECGPQFSVSNFNVCKKNHTFCDFCYENVYRLTGCETCTKEGVTERCFYPNPPDYEPNVCISKSRGCRFSSEDPEVLGRHNQGCKFRGVNCEAFVFGLARCYWVGPISDIPDHFEEEHPDFINQVFNDTMVVAKFNLSKEQSSIHVIRFEDELFYYKHKLDLRKGKFFVAVQMVGLEEIANKYFYQLYIKVASRTMNLLEMCHSDGMEYSHIMQSEKCAVIPVKTIQKYVVNDELRFELKISRMV